MDDAAIIELYWERREEAIAASERKYGGYCHTVAIHILDSSEDAEECVSDTWLRAWNTIPPQRPARLRAFFGKITRNLAIDRWRERSAEKRGGGGPEVALEELGEVAGGSGPEGEVDRRELERALSRFLRTLPRRDADIFLRRYFFMFSTGEIAAEFGLKDGNVLLILSRTRKKLRDYLQKEGYDL